jgi:hypothetical protein
MSGIGQLWQDSQNKTAVEEQPEKNSRRRTGGEEHPRQNSEGRTAGTRQRRKVGWDRTTGTGQSIRVGLKNQPGLVIVDRTEGRGWPEYYSKDWTAGTAPAETGQSAKVGLTSQAA